MMHLLKPIFMHSAMFFVQTTVIFCIAALPVVLMSTENKKESEAGNADDGKSFDPSNDFYQHNAHDLKGNIVPLKRFRGKVSLVVNVASQCGYTEQHYKDLVKLQKDFGPTDRFNVLAFPCNQFGAQEPGTNSEIEQFVKRKYNVNFPVFSKINVSGDDAPETWKLLTAESGQVPSWNFFKYLVNGNGHVVKSWGPWIDVPSIKHDIHDAIEELTPPHLPYEEHHDKHDRDHEEL